MLYTDCPNCAGSGVSFGKRCACVVATAAVTDCRACGGSNKECSMNCSSLPIDTRSRHDRLRECDECWNGCRVCEDAAASASMALARSDAARFEWALPLLTGDSYGLLSGRVDALLAATQTGLKGRDLVDHAMTISRTGNN